jgi:hypothetical protein
MDGGERERSVANSIKAVVKRTSRRKGAANLEQRTMSVRIAPKSSTSLDENLSSSSDVTPQANVEVSQESAVDMETEPAVRF